MSKGRLAIPVVVFLLLSVFGLAACGGGESDEDKITSVIETAATTTDPAECEPTQTVAFMEQTSGKEGKDAVKDCEEKAEEGKNNPESVEVTEVEVEGEEATATASFAGGTLGGQTLVVGLVKEEGDWKLNEAVEFVNLDREKLIGAFEKAFEEEAEIEPALAECVIEGIEKASDTELEGFVIGGQEGVVEIAEECAE